MSACPICGGQLDVCFGFRTVFVECESRSCLYTQEADRDELREACMRTYRKNAGMTIERAPFDIPRV